MKSTGPSRHFKLMSEHWTETMAMGPPGGPRTPPLARGSSLGRYVILGPVGSGGMGVVYAAYDPELDRKVALKLLRPDRAGEATRLRLLREAQAVARLSHPNVVAVFDVGTLDGQVFIAMELVQGRNLRQWLREERRPWSPVLAALLAAGRGLAAAHAAGLVHRDVKPDNVLIGDDGRVRMGDFGLACQEGAPDEEGCAVGTPAYMAPEQLRGEAADARSDQYSFCATLWEALFGERPPAGDHRRVPSWLRQALLRGLSADPAERHPSLEALLAVLARDPAVFRRRWLAAAAVVLAAGASVLAWERGRESRFPLCRMEEEQLTDIWNGARKRALQAAFAATGEPQAMAAWSATVRTLDDYAAQWTTMHRDACEATWLRGVQSEALLDNRILCLEQRRSDLDALVHVFGQADAEVVRSARDASAQLPSLSECSDKESLLRRRPRSRDKDVRKRLAEVDAHLSEGQALFRAGKIDQGLAVMSEACQQADALGDPLLQSDCYFLLGEAEDARGEYVRAEDALYRAIWAADRGADDVRRGWIWRRLAYVAGYHRRQPEEGLRLLRHGRAILARVGSHPRLEAALLNTEGGLLATLGRSAEAASLYRASLAISKEHDPRNYKLYIVYANLGEVELSLGEAEQARLHQQQALDLAASSPVVDVFVLDSLRFFLSNALIELGRYDEAIKILRQVAVSQEARLGPNHPDLAETLRSLGTAWTRKGQPDLGLPFLERALAIHEARSPAGSPYRELARTALGETLLRLRRFPEAEAQLRQALAALEAEQEPTFSVLSMPLIQLGQLRLDQGRPAAAIPLLERAVALLDRASAFPQQRTEAAALLAQARELTP